MSTYLITGATGQQGGATARALLSSGQKVHALVRDPTSPASLALQSLGATLFKGSFEDIPSIQAAAQGCEGVFVNTHPDEGEVQHGKNIIAGSLAAGVKHAIYTSVLNTGRHLQFPGWEEEIKPTFMGMYWENKHALEEAVRGSGFQRWTILRPGNFMSNYTKGKLVGQMYPELWSEGLLKSDFEEDTKIYLVDVDDIGIVAARAFTDEGGKRWSGRTIDIVGDNATLREAVATLGDVAGREFKIVKYSEGERLGPRAVIALGQRLHAKLGRIGGFEADLSALKEMGVQMRGWREFLEDKKKRGELV